MLFKYFFKRYYLLIPYVIIIVLAPIVNVNSSYMSAEMMDSATAGNYQKFLSILNVVFICFVIHGLLLFLSHVLRARLIKYGRELLKKDMFSHLMSSENYTFSKSDIGIHIATFSNDISILEYKYFEAWLEALESILSILTAATAIMTLNRNLAMVIILGELASVAVCLAVRSYSIKKNSVYIEKLAHFTQHIKDYFSAFQTIHNFLAEAKINQKFSLLNKETEETKFNADMSLSFADTLAKICNSVLKFIVVGYGIVLMIQGDITLGLIYAAYQFCDQIISPMHVLLSKINSIESVKSIVDRVKLLVRSSKNVININNLTFDNTSGIQLKGLSVAFNNTTVLNNINHSFFPRKKYLIIGKNGAGKSTLLRTLKKSIDQYEGTIKIGGQDIKNIPYAQLSEKVSYINESVSLLCDTVRQNIVLFRDIDEYHLEDVIKTVGLTVPLARIVKDGERNLSSGETRRIEIARSLINCAEVIVYDEAISTLDVQTAYSIEKTLLSLDKQMVIFVSHNFSASLIRQYDEIILMENGCITDFGTHDELLSRNSYYQKIIKIKNG